MHPKENKSALEVVRRYCMRVESLTIRRLPSQWFARVGASVVNALSEYCHVEVKRDGRFISSHTKKVFRIFQFEIVGVADRTGTKTTFKPDNDHLPRRRFSLKSLLNDFANFAF